MDKPKVTQGSFTCLRTNSRLLFVLNPTTIKVEVASNISEDPIPGFSDPKLNWASGKGKDISFTLQVNAELIRRLGKPMPNGADPALASDLARGVFTIQGELAWLEQFHHPTGSADSGTKNEPDRIVFNWGPLFRNKVCLLETSSPDITEFGPEGHPTHANISVKLKPVVGDNVYANDIWRP